MPFTENEILDGYTCPVCGFTMGATPSDFNICPSCGTEFGNDDCDWTIEQLRQAWIDTGAQWWSQNQAAPDGWNSVEQLLRVIPISISAPLESNTVIEYRFFEIAPGSGNWGLWRSTGSEVEPCPV